MIHGVPGQGGNADGYLDEVLNNVRNNAEVRQKIDPLRIDNISFKKGSASDVIRNNYKELCLKPLHGNQSRILGMRISLSFDQMFQAMIFLISFR